MPIDQATIDTLVAKVGKLGADKAAADQAAAQSSAAQVALQQAQAQADAAEGIRAAADATLAASLADLQTFVAGLSPSQAALFHAYAFTRGARPQPATR